MTTDVTDRALPALREAAAALRAYDWTPSVELAQRLIHGAELALAEDDSAERAVQVKDTLKFMQQQFRRRGGQLVEGNVLAAGRVRTEHELGQRLDRDATNGTRRRSEDGRPEISVMSYDAYSLADIGLNRNDAMRFRRVGSIDRADLDAVIQGELDKGTEGDEISTAWALRLYRQTHAPAEPEWPSLPDGMFNLLYADPPWRYEFAVDPEGRSIENQYPTATVEQLCEERFVADIRAHTAADAVLFLWATSPKLTEALDLVRAWGFEYRTNLVWVKDRMGMGYYAREQHELLLVAKRGEPPVPAASDRVSSVIEAPRGRHSEKPVAVYDLLESMYPQAVRLELFGRKPREGWEVWGNEL